MYTVVGIICALLPPQPQLIAAESAPLTQRMRLRVTPIRFGRRRGGYASETTLLVAEVGQIHCRTVLNQLCGFSLRTLSKAQLFRAADGQCEDIVILTDGGIKGTPKNKVVRFNYRHSAIESSMYTTHQC